MGDGHRSLHDGNMIERSSHDAHGAAERAFAFGAEGNDLRSQQTPLVGCFQGRDIGRVIVPSVQSEATDSAEDFGRSTP